MKKMHEITLCLYPNYEGYIRLSSHAKKQLKARGYTVQDVVECLLTGEIVEIRRGFNRKLHRICPNYAIEGKDIDHHPIVVVLSEEERGFSVITVMLPTDKRFRSAL